MTDTAPVSIEPVLDLDAMLEDLHNEFQGEPEGDGTSGDGGVPPVQEEELDRPTSGEPTSPSPDAELDHVLPPGMVQFGEEVLPQDEVKALLEFNRRVKGDADTASRVRKALLGEQEAQTAPEQPDALPIHIDPEDQQAVFLFRQQQRIDAEIQEVRRLEQQRLQQQAQTAEQRRQAEVIDAFRAGMREFRGEYPDFTVADVKSLTDRAANMGLLNHPEELGETLQGGFVRALELVMWDSPDHRARITAGGTVRTKEQQAATRKQKSSALSSSTGSTPRTQSQEPAPTNRQEVIASGLEFIRSQGSIE